jgi:hypothetical protein
MKWLALIVLLLAGCITEPDVRPRVEAWFEEIPDSLMLWDPVEWTGITFLATQTPPDTTWWTLDWMDAGIRIDAGQELPGLNVVQALYFPKQRFRGFFLFAAWGPNARADTAIYVRH